MSINTRSELLENLFSGEIVAPVRLDKGLKPGLAFMTFHFPDEVDVNVITIEATCPVAGTAEYKAAAIRVDKLAVEV